MSDESTQNPQEKVSEAAKVGMYHRDDSDRISFDHLFATETEPLKSIFRGQVFVKGIKNTKISSDIIDFVFETYVSNPTAIALQINYNIPGVMDIISNINNKNIHWEVTSFPGKDGEKGKIEISIRFTLSQEEFDARIQELRAAGFKDNFIKISDEEYIDYGEIEKVCQIKYFVYDDAEWIVREEPVQIAEHSPEEDPDHSSNDDDAISGFISGISIMKNSENKALYGDTSGAIFIGFASPNPIFSNEQIANVVEVDPDETKTKVEIRIDPDAECTPIARDRSEFDSDDAYDDYLKSELHRTDRMKKYWRNVFGSPSNMIQEMVRMYAADYAESHEVDGKAFSGTVPITRQVFEDYVNDHGMLDMFKSELERTFDESLYNDSSIEAGERKPINEEIRTSAAAMEVIKEYESIIPDWNAALMSTAKEYGCLEGTDEKPALNPKAERYQEFVKAFMDHDICKRAAMILHRYIVQVMRDTGEFDEAFLTNDTPELRNHKVYKEIAQQITSLAKIQ